MYLTLRLIVSIIFLSFVGAEALALRDISSQNSSYDRETLVNAGLSRGADLQYFGTVGFGTPPQTFNLMFDTSTSGIEIPGIMCVIPCMIQQQFDYTASLTFKNLQTKTNLLFGTGNPTSAALQSMDILKVEDTMTFLGQRFPAIRFNLITNQTSGFFSNPYDGIIGEGSPLGFVIADFRLGLNLDPHSVIYGALRKMGYPVMFGLYLTPSRVGDAEFIVGGIDESKLNGTSLAWAPVLKSNTTNNQWTLVVSNIYVNDNVVDSSLVRNQPFAFHTGESNIVLGKQLASVMYSHISPKIAAIGTNGNYGVPCNNIPSLAADIKFEFTSTSGTPFNLTLPTKDLNAGPFVDNPTICQTAINSADIQGGIIGVPILKHYYSIWDVDNGQMGFADNGY